MKSNFATLTLLHFFTPTPIAYPMTLIPYVIEKSGREERAMDIYSRLLKDRIVMLGSSIGDDAANTVVASCSFCNRTTRRRISICI